MSSARAAARRCSWQGWFLVSFGVLANSNQSHADKPIYHHSQSEPRLQLPPPACITHHLALPHPAYPMYSILFAHTLSLSQPKLAYLTAGPRTLRAPVQGPDATPAANASKPETASAKAKAQSQPAKGGKGGKSKTSAAPVVVAVGKGAKGGKGQEGTAKGKGGKGNGKPAKMKTLE